MENLLKTENNIYLRYLFCRPLYSALVTNLPLPTTPLFGSKQNKLLEGWRKLQIEELLNLYSSSNNIWVINDDKSGAA
jgi:predicted DNA-binding helix-hairpin-helix protein